MKFNPTSGLLLTQAARLYTKTIRNHISESYTLEAGLVRIGGRL